MIRLALVAGSAWPDLGGELDLIATALAGAGIEADVVAWDDPGIDLTAYDAAAVRSTWDYFERAEEFRDWIDLASDSTLLANSGALLHWNLDKVYLTDLAAAGIPIVDTLVVRPGQRFDDPDWAEVVVKPAISAGSRLSGRFANGDAGIRRTIARIHHEGNAAMLQPYAPAVDLDGEVNVLAFGGVASHALSKRGGLDLGREPDLDTHPHLGDAVQPVPLTDELVDFTATVLAAIPSAAGLTGTDKPIYARIDSVVVADGTRRLMEAELIEPFLYLSQAPDPSAAASRYATALRTWIDEA